jgi:hypothetical protein
MYEKKVARQYFRELGGALAVYVVLLVGAIRLGRPMDQGVVRTLVLLAPMLGFGLAIWAIARHLNRVDEYIRQYLLEAVAISAAITCALTFSYGFLETAGYPRLSMFIVWMVMCGAMLVVCAVRALFKR